MSALGDIITAAVNGFIADNPKLFADEKAAERAQKILPREIMKSLTREPKTDGEQTPAEEPQESLRRVPAADPRAIAYRNLREAAGAARAVYSSGDLVYIPAEADIPAVHAFAAMPNKTAWPFVSKRPQLIAWLEFFDAVLPNVARRSIITTRSDAMGGVKGACLPWPWPPSKAGKIYETETQPELQDAEP